jgi:hypothetical protein
MSVTPESTVSIVDVTAPNDDVVVVMFAGSTLMIYVGAVPDGYIISDIYQLPHMSLTFIVKYGAPAILAVNVSDVNVVLLDKTVVPCMTYTFEGYGMLPIIFVTTIDDAGGEYVLVHVL